MIPQASRENGYSFHLVNIECMPSSARFNVVMELEEPIGELLPYIAAAFPGCNYTHASGVVNFMDSGHIVSIRPDHVTITDVGGEEQAAEYCRKYFRAIRDIGGRKDRITPVYESRPRVQVLDIYLALPQTNCGQCRAGACMAFAAQVFRREARMGECPPFMEKAEAHRPLLEQLQANGYEL
jgi:ArsR family metal-binding transcriptional regulator